jgi:signal transduction histidine kinase
LLLNICDDGVGFYVKNKKKGIGLQNMSSRIKECEGTFEMHSKKGVGTTISVSIPIKKT